MAKSLCLAYFFWAIGGCFGLHHIYLGRDRHAFLVWSTGAGYFGLGLLRDLWRIPSYVKDANNDPGYLNELVEKMRKHDRPPYNFFRQAGQVIAGNVWGLAFRLAVPLETLYGIDLQWLLALTPVAIALGVHTAGNVGRERGHIYWPLLGACSLFVTQYLDIDGISLASLISSSLFESKATEWRRKPSPKSNMCRRFAALSLCCLLYSSLWASYLYFNAEVADSTGEPVKLRDAVVHFFTSPLWMDLKVILKQSLYNLWNQGLHETWKQLMTELDPHGEHQALKVLGLESGVSQEEIATRWRRMSKEWHPDRYQDEDKKLVAQEKFMELNAAYETLSKIKSRRLRKNNQFQDL